MLSQGLGLSLSLGDYCPGNSRQDPHSKVAEVIRSPPGCPAATFLLGLSTAVWDTEGDPGDPEVRTWVTEGTAALSA